MITLTSALRTTVSINEIWSSYFEAFSNADLTPDSLIWSQTPDSGVWLQIGESGVSIGVYF